ncbi:hypothetical protein [Nocardioides lijunqiniae]|uniref:hypothetical protein n=1 Tax=Nocardioides lijunqiniae TaxID=2760832 RepID=UPI0018780D2D|nr:hypothetical protein [Nocardioides lijunqiniae]
MSEDWSVPAWTIVSALVVVLLLAAALVLSTVRGRRRAARDRAAAQAESAQLREQVAEIARRLDAAVAAPVPARPAADASDYVITRIGTAEEPAPVVPAPVFADLVMRESVVRAASLVAGLRRALAPETRNRIRFEMRREVKRSRKQRRADLKTARREWEARQRADVDEDSAA